jgi:hypothetical protein
MDKENESQICMYSVTMKLVGEITGTVCDNLLNE